jgi:hypothetical protein
LPIRQADDRQARRQVLGNECSEARAAILRQREGALQMPRDRGRVRLPSDCQQIGAHPNDSALPRNDDEAAQGACDASSVNRYKSCDTQEIQERPGDVCWDASLSVSGARAVSIGLAAVATDLPGDPAMPMRVAMSVQEAMAVPPRTAERTASGRRQSPGQPDG